MPVMREPCLQDAPEAGVEQLHIKSERELMAIHDHEPQAARWFALGALALQQGLLVTYYAENGIEARASRNAKGEVYDLSIDAEDEGRRWHWSYSWTANAGCANEEQVEDAGTAATWPEAVAACMATMEGLFVPR
jgi:hypothetical protein